MSSERYDLSELRKLVEQSIDQTDRAVGFFFEAANRSASMAPSAVTEFSKQSLSFMETSTKDALGHLKMLFNAASLKEAMDIQTRYLQGQVHTVGEHMAKVAKLTSAKKANHPKSGSN